MAEPNARSWKQLLVEALTETDNEKLTKRVHDAEGAIFLRWQELAGSSDHHEERKAMDVACAALLYIQVNDLGWPCSLPEGKTLLPPRQQVFSRKTSTN
jgi:hypothetical protein